MKLVMSEQVKHRLTGLGVILSVAVIFLPALLKQSNHHLEENLSFSVKLPPKPLAPKVVMTDEKSLFRSVKVAQVNIPKITPAPQATQIARAEPLMIKSVVPPAPVLNTEPQLATVVPPVKLALAPIKKLAPTAPKKLSKLASSPKKGGYAVQLASFSQQNNAKTLVSRLRSKGYQASYNKFSGKQGEYYKVIVGQLEQRDAAINLQKKLAQSMQINGFIVKTGVS